MLYKNLKVVRWTTIINFSDSNSKNIGVLINNIENPSITSKYIEERENRSWSVLWPTLQRSRLYTITWTVFANNYDDLLTARNLVDSTFSLNYKWDTHLTLLWSHKPTTIQNRRVTWEIYSLPKYTKKDWAFKYLYDFEVEIVTSDSRIFWDTNIIVSVPSTVNYEGTLETYPTITITWSLADVSITNETTWEKIEFRSDCSYSNAILEFDNDSQLYLMYSWVNDLSFYKKRNSLPITLTPWENIISVIWSVTVSFTYNNTYIN